MGQSYWLPSSDFVLSPVSSDQWTTKPLNKCSAQDLIATMKHYKFSELTEHSMDQKIKTHDVQGYEFTELAKAVAVVDKEKERQEKENLINSLSTKLKIPKTVANAFLEEVILEKIKQDIQQSQDLVTTSETTYEKHRATIMPQSVSLVSDASTSGPIVENSNFKNDDVFPDSSLTDWEKKGVTEFKKKLQEFEKSWSIKLTDVGYTGNYDADAQNSVCRDRFMYKTFGKPILSNKKRKDTRNAPFIAIKLVISELGGNTVHKLARKLIANAVDTEFGILHTGIIIGEWKFDWYNNSIVSVKTNMNASNSISVIDLGYLNQVDQIKDAFESIAKICCIYNATKTYHQMSCNCQHFVKDILDSLGINKPSGGSFDKYFEDLKSGTTKRKYYYSYTLQQFMNSNPKAEKYKEFYGRKEIEFADRASIDLFCYWLESLKYFSTEEGKIDFKLLKAFDRSFCISGNTQGLTVIDYSTKSGLKSQSFFGVKGSFEDNSIKNIEYNVRDLHISVPNYKTRKLGSVN
ncbi:hypothetical protein C9374_008998 [Naegleria lovaniensis]|uniref:PPPDE domain-containing protein n=1 Tax=Naegleria lovaniensis TaxID=51637 RepID=A0AA88GG32_NAELO|nr:uncharacterized protein C9374_008998 [Naegleria lovaniensis]KAG2377913.1 hypothetical protein C9374_008998 [Naegleria lovaniensis]